MRGKAVRNPRHRIASHIILKNGIKNFASRFSIVYNLAILSPRDVRITRCSGVQNLLEVESLHQKIPSDFKPLLLLLRAFANCERTRERKREKGWGSREREEV